jgi:site-specific DNA recombinase
MTIPKKEVFMAREITLVKPAKDFDLQLKNVCAYARVSTGKESMLHSLSAQVSYYQNLIKRHREWRFCGVYADEALTGTKENREKFQEMLRECKNGNIDLIITKSISRFARNTVTLLETVRELKDIGVDVYFEEQNINTMSTDGELMLTILASYAQEESLSASENMKWRIKKLFEQGLLPSGRLLGYKYNDGHYEVIQEEAEIVKRIFSMYLGGMGRMRIAKQLNRESVRTRFDRDWCAVSINGILRNYSYTGNLLLQTTYSENHLTKKNMINKGELPMYHVENTHEAIVSLEDYNAVKAEMARRAALVKPKNPSPKKSYPFSGLIKCMVCGSTYMRHTTKTQKTWICHDFNFLGKDKCASKQVPESVLESLTAEVVGSISNIAEVERIEADNGNKLTFILKNGERVDKVWKDRSRSESWTEEKRKAFGEMRRRRNAECRK